MHLERGATKVPSHPLSWNLTGVPQDHSPLRLTVSLVGLLDERVIDKFIGTCSPSLARARLTKRQPSKPKSSASAALMLVTKSCARHTYIYIYIYIGMCSCGYDYAQTDVCVCVCVFMRLPSLGWKQEDSYHWLARLFEWMCQASERFSRVKALTRGFVQMSPIAASCCTFWTPLKLFPNETKGKPGPHSLPLRQPESQATLNWA